MKRLVAFVLVFAFAFCGFPVALAENGSDISVGNTVILGKYEQDNDTSNGVEPIEWLVIAKDGDNALLISKFCLDCREYDAGDNVTWAVSRIRAWLNGVFVNSVFSPKERSVIRKTFVKADRNPTYDTNPGSDVFDNVFLLSVAEAEKYFGEDSLRKAENTPNAMAFNAGNAETGDKCEWWLRTPGSSASNAAVVREDGAILTDGIECGNGSVAVRPAFWADVSKLDKMADTSPSEQANPFESVLLTFDDGTAVTAYAARPIGLIGSWDSFGHLGDRFSFNSTLTNAFEMNGDISDCYGITIAYTVDSIKNGETTLVSAGLKPGIRMDGKWDSGDFYSIVTPVVGERLYLTAIHKNPGKLSAYTIVMNQVVRGKVSWRDSFWSDTTLYFATQSAAENYIRSLIGG